LWVPCSDADSLSHQGTHKGCPYDTFMDNTSSLDPGIHNRHSIRLRGYDYSQAGVYFVTICTERRECLFGVVENGEMYLNEAGCMVEALCDELPQRFPGVELSTKIVMPNHFHGILSITEHTRRDSGVASAGHLQGVPLRTETKRASLGTIIGAFKSLTTNEYISGVSEHAWQPFPGRLWQRNFYEHIIRDQREFDAITESICATPANWDKDENNPITW